MNSDKLLPFEFFKAIGFERKSDGMEFIEAHKNLADFVEKIVYEINEMVEEKKEEIADKFQDYPEDFELYKKMIKEQRKNKIQEKKDALKEQLRQEVLAEIAKENEPYVVPNLDWSFIEKINSVINKENPSAEMKSIASEVLRLHERLRELSLEIDEKEKIQEQKPEKIDSKKPRKYVKKTAKNVEK